MADNHDTKPLSQSEIFAGLLGKLASAVDRIEGKQDAGFVAVKADFNLLAGQFASLETDVRGLQSWRVRTDDKLQLTIERTARTSDKARSLSDADLALASTQSIEINKGREQDRRLDETHALVTAAAVKLGELATAADARSKVLDSIADQVGKALKSKRAEQVAYAAGGFVIAVLAYYTKKFLGG